MIITITSNRITSNQFRDNVLKIVHFKFSSKFTCTLFLNLLEKILDNGKTYA